MDTQLTLEDLLDNFSSQELADALFASGNATSGSKADRIARLMSLGFETPDLLDLFTTEPLRFVCSNLDIPNGRKAEMIAALSRLVAVQRPTDPRSAVSEVAVDPDGSILGDIFGIVSELASKVTGPSAAPSAVPAPSRQYLAPTREALLARLSELTLPRRRVRIESDAQALVHAALTNSFEHVAREYNVGGYLGLKIDVDIGDGKAGVEVKLAASLANAGEVHRLIGQAIYYHRRRYREALVIAIVGSDEDLQRPVLREATTFLSELGIVSIPIRLVS